MTQGRYKSANLEENGYYSKQTTIEYEIEGKIVIIYGGVHNIILSDWWIQKYTKDKFILKKEPNSENESLLTLKKY